MTLDLGVLVDLVIIATHHGLVAKEMDGLEAFVLDVPQAVGLIPARGENIKGDLSADGEGQAYVGEGLLELLHKGLAHLVDGIIPVKFIPLFLGAIPANGGNVDHSIAELDKGTPG